MAKQSNTKEAIDSSNHNLDRIEADKAERNK